MERQPLTEFLSIRRPLTPSYLSSLADATTSANFAIAVCSRPARPRFHISKDLGRPRSGDVAAFLGKTRAIQAVTRRQAAVKRPGNTPEGFMANCSTLPPPRPRLPFSYATTEGLGSLEPVDG